MNLGDRLVPNDASSPTFASPSDVPGRVELGRCVEGERNSIARANEHQSLNVRNSGLGQASRHCWRLSEHVATHALPQAARAEIAPPEAFSLFSRTECFHSLPRRCVVLKLPYGRLRSFTHTGPDLDQRGQCQYHSHRSGHHLDYGSAFRFSGGIRNDRGLRQHQFAGCRQDRRPLDNTDRPGGGDDVSFPGAVGRRERSVSRQPGLYPQASCDPLAGGESGKLEFWLRCAAKVQRRPVDHPDQQRQFTNHPRTFLAHRSKRGDFAFGGLGSCHTGQVLAPGASCTDSLKFCPTVAGSRSAADTIPNDTPSSPIVVSLSGTGAAAATSSLAVSPTSLTFAGQSGASSLTPASVSITNTGAGSLAFTGASDQPWLVLSATSGTAPSTLQVIASITGLKAGSYTGHVTLAGGGVTKTVTAVLTVTSPPVQHSVALSWKASTNTHVVSYNVYRSTISGSSYGLSASALGSANYTDQTVQSGATYYYVVTAVDDQGRESTYSNQTNTPIP